MLEKGERTTRRSLVFFAPLPSQLAPPRASLWWSSFCLRGGLAGFLLSSLPVSACSGASGDSARQSEVERPSVRPSLAERFSDFRNRISEGCLARCDNNKRGSSAIRKRCRAGHVQETPVSFLIISSGSIMSAAAAAAAAAERGIRCTSKSQAQCTGPFGVKCEWL
jgi:hypothetical protein